MHIVTVRRIFAIRPSNPATVYAITHHTNIQLCHWPFVYGLSFNRNFRSMAFILRHAYYQRFGLIILKEESPVRSWQAGSYRIDIKPLRHCEKRFDYVNGL